MIKYNDKCTGCTACENVCKFNAIKMQDDKDGFKYPHIDKKLCVDCKACEKVCPLNSKKKIKKNLKTRHMLAFVTIIVLD